MAKKKLETEFPTFESDLDFNFDDEISDGIDQNAIKSKKRGVVTNVIAGAKDGVKDTLKDPGFIKQTLRKILPDTYGEIATGTQELATGMYTLYDQPIRELKPRINSIMKKVDTLVPEGQKTLKALSEKIQNWSGGKDYANSSTAENQDEQAVSSMLGAIFQQNKTYSDIAQRKEVLKDVTEKKRFATSTNIMDEIRQNTSVLSQYTTNVTQAYQRKMLELTLRSYLVQRDNLMSFKDFAKTSKLQYEAIIKNTAMPEFLKITKTEAFMEAGRRNIINALYGDGSKLQKGIAKFKGSVMEMASGAAMALDNIDMGLDQAMSAREAIQMQNEMLTSMGLPPLTKAEMAGAMAAGNAVEWLRDKIAKPIKEKLGKDKKLTEGLGKVSRHMMNPAGFISKVRGGEDWEEKKQAQGPKGAAYRFMDFIMEHFTDEGPGKTFENKFDTSKLNAPAMGFDNKAHLSLTEVIPGHLAAIHREIRILRTNDESTPLSTYDFQRREFVTDKTMGARIMADLKQEAYYSKSKDSIDKAADSFKGNIVLNDEEEVELKLFFSRIARIGNMEITPENIRNTSAFEKLSFNVKTLVNKKLEEMDTSEDREVELSNLTRKVTDIRAGFPSMEASIGNAINTGYGDVLANQKVKFKDYNGQMQERGIIQRTEDGNFVRDEEAFNAFLEQNGITRPNKEIATSDINAKEAIRTMDPKDLLNSVSDRFKKSIKSTAAKLSPEKAYEGIKKTKLYNWFYKDGQGDGEEHSGPMAQDVNKNLGEEAAPTGKKIDLVSLNGANMAAVKHLGDKVEEMKNDGRGKTNKDILLQIEKNTAQIVEKMGFSFGLGLNPADIDFDKLKEQILKAASTAKDKVQSRATTITGLVQDKFKNLLTKIDDGIKEKRSGLHTGDIGSLTGEDLENIRTMKNCLKEEGFAKKCADFFFGKFPQYLEADTSDEAIAKAYANPDAGLKVSPEDRTSLALLGSIVAKIGQKAGRGVMFLTEKGKSIFNFGKDKVVKPFWAEAVPLFKKALNKIDQAVSSSKEYTSRFSADDLMTIKEMKDLLKSKSKKAKETAEAYFKRFPEYLHIDTSDEAIEKASKDPSQGSQKSSEERSVLAMATSILSSVTGRVFDFGKNIVNNIIPSAIKSIKDFAAKTLGEIGKKVNPIRDLYIPGHKRPAIRATKLAKGDYRDNSTNKPLFTIDEVMKCKSDIVNEKGNVVVSIEDLQNGLVDRSGQLVKSNMMTAVAGVVGAGFALKDRFVSNLKYLKETGSKVFGKIKDKITGALPGNSESNGFGFGLGSKYLKDGYQVWVDIRSIMLGQGDEVKKRLGIKDKIGFGSGVTEGSSSSEEDEEDSESAQATSNGSAPDIFGSSGRSGGGTGNGTTGGGVTRRGQLKTIAGAKRKFRNFKTGAADKFGRLKNSGFGTKVGSVFGKGKSKVGDQVARLKNTGIGQKTSSWAGKAGDQLSRLKNSSFGSKSGSLAKNIGGKGLRLAKWGGKKIAGGVLGLGALAMNAFGSNSNQGGQQEPGAEGEKNAANDPEKAKALAERARPGEKVVKTKIAADKRAADDKDGDGDKDGSVEDRKEKLEELKASRQKEGAQADLTARYTTGGLMKDLMGKVDGLFGFVKSGLGSLMDFGQSLVGDWLLNKAGQKVMGKVAQQGGKMLVQQGGKMAVQAGARAAVSGGIRMLATTALRSAAVAAISAAPAILSAAAGVAGTALTAIGGVLASPVVIGAAAVAATAYGGYKLYKYMTRNNANEFDRIRLRQYGVGDNTAFEEYNNRFFGLEQYLLDGKIGYSNGKAYTIDRNIKAEDIAEIFKVDKEDKEHGENVAKWYSERFKPFFLTHLTALQTANKKGKLDSISSLKPSEKLKYLEGISFDSGPYQVNVSPIKGIDNLSTDSKPVLESIQILIETAGKEAKKDAKAIGLPARGGSDATTHRADVAEADKNERLRKQKKAADEKKALADSLKASDAREAKMLPRSAKEKATGQGEGDGPTPSVPKQLTPENKAPVSTGPIPMAAGAPLPSTGGDKYLKLQPGVDIEHLRPPVRDMLLSMAAEYGEKTGKSIQINSGYRSYEKQAALHKADPSGAAPPGRSLHEFGLAIDIQPGDVNELEKLGLMKKYGFTRPVGGEDWHTEPAGIQKDIGLAIKDPDQADSMTLASFRRGGGGAGTDPNSVKHRRNSELAVSLLNNPGVTAKETIDASSKDAPLGGKPILASKDTTASPTSVSMPAPTAVGVSSGMNGQPAANDAQKDGKVIRANFRPGTQDDSTNKNLPPATNVSAQGTETAETQPAASSSNDKNGDIKDTIVKNAKKAGGDPNLMLAFAAVESGLKPNAKAKGSSAAGLFQFTKDTWDEQLGKHGRKYGLDPNTTPFDADASTLLATEYVKSNLNSIKNVKPDPNVTDAYLTHFLGAGGAKKFLSQDPNAIAANVLPVAAASNKEIFGTNKSVGTVYNDLSQKLTKRASEFGVKPVTGSLSTSSTTDQPEKPLLNEPGAGGAQSASATTSSAISTPAATASPGTTGIDTVQAAKDKREMISQSPNSGVFVDKRGSSMVARERREVGESFSGPNMMNIETSLNQSLGIQKDQLEVLRGILDNVSPEKLGKILADAVAASAKPASNQETMKEKDDRNMGRKDLAPRSSIDFSRKVM